MSENINQGTDYVQLNIYLEKQKEYIDIFVHVYNVALYKHIILKLE